jgi:hypothetical protein
MKDDWKEHPDWENMDEEDLERRFYAVVHANLQLIWKELSEMNGTLRKIADKMR